MNPAPFQSRPPVHMQMYRATANEGPGFGKHAKRFRRKEGATTIKFVGEKCDSISPRH